MAQFTRATTPDITIIIDAFDATGNDAYVTIKQGSGRMLTLTGDRLTVTVDDSGETPTTRIELKLTQAETLKFKRGDAEVQARFIDSTGEAPATGVVTIRIDPILYEKVITYGGAQ